MLATLIWLNPLGLGLDPEAFIHLIYYIIFYIFPVASTVFSLDTLIMNSQIRQRNQVDIYLGTSLFLIQAEELVSIVRWLIVKS